MSVELIRLIDELELLVKHLPGRHNQYRHGWRYGAVSSAQLEHWDKLAEKMGADEFHEYSKRWQGKYEAGAFEAEEKKVELQRTIERRLALGHDQELDAESEGYWREAIREMRPTELVESVDEVPAVQGGWTHGRHMRGYFITSDDKLAPLSNEFSGGTNDHVGFMALSDRPEVFGLTERDANNLLADYMDMSLTSYQEAGRVWEKAYEAGTVRVREFGDSTAINTQRMDKATLRRMQRLYDQGKFTADWNGTVVWQDTDTYNYVRVPTTVFLDASSIGELERAHIR